MRFLKTLNASFVRIDQIIKIDHECNEFNGRNQSEDVYYSYLYLKDGSKYDFLDVPRTFQINENKKKFTCEHLIQWHEKAIQCLLMNNNDSCFPLDIDIVMDESWKSFMHEIEKK